MRKFLRFGILLVLIFTILVACNQESTKSGNSNDGGGDEKSRHAIIFKSTGNPFGEKLMEGLEDAIKEVGDEAILRAPDQPTVEGQIQIIEELIAQKVDSITIAAND